MTSDTGSGTATATDVVLRPMRAPDDYFGMNAAANAARGADGNEWVTTDEQFAIFYEHLSNCDPATDVVIAEREGRIVGYGRASWYEAHEDGRIYEPTILVDPGADVPGLDERLEEWLERRVREIAATHPPGRKWFQESASDSAAERIVRLARSGYEPVRYFYVMVRPHLDDLADAPLPEGLEIREVQPDQLRQIWDASTEAFEDHWGDGVPTEEDYQQFLTDPIQGDTSLWRVAWEGDQVAGQVRSFINPAENERYGRKRGWVENIAVRRPWRRRGLARALIAASFPLLRARGMTEGALGVDTANPTGALGVYERCGFVPVSREATYRKPLE
jgi:ribosomal protein S18 acetylase RimI-like enzyme